MPDIEMESHRVVSLVLSVLLLISSKQQGKGKSGRVECQRVKEKKGKGETARFHPPGSECNDGPGRELVGEFQMEPGWEVVGKLDGE